MANFTINLGSTHDVNRAGQIVRVDIDKLPTQIIEQLVYHGLTQKVGDAAAGKKDDEAKTAMEGVIATLYDGNWGKQRAAGNGIDRFVRQAMLAAFKAETQKALKAMKADERNETIDEKYLELSEDIKAKIDANAAKLRKIAEDAKKASAAIGIDLDI